MGLAPMTGEAVEDGVGVGEVGVVIWLIPGISEMSRLNALDPLALPEEDELPDAAAVSPGPPDDVLVDVVEADDGPAEAKAADETAARLL